MPNTNRDETRNEALEETPEGFSPDEKSPPADGAPQDGAPGEERAGEADAVQARLAALEKTVEDLQQQLLAEKDKFLRLAAEYDNFRKRTLRERESLSTDARADTIAQLLPVYDNLALAVTQPCSDEAYFKGIQMIMAQLAEIFRKLGVTEIPALGESFDPNRHNAVMHVEDPEQGQNVVVAEFQKGFMLGDRIIRHSIVKVAN